MATGMARWVSASAGIWMFVSAALLPGTPWQRAAQSLLGMVAFLVAIVAMAYSGFRRINTALAFLAILIPFVEALPANAASLNLLASGMVVLVASLWPGPMQPGYQRESHGRGHRS